MNTLASRLEAAILKVCQNIDGVSIGSRLDRKTWRIDFAPSASAGDKLLANQVLQDFDPTEPPAPLPPITPRQLRLMLPYVSVTLEDISAAIEAIPDESERYVAGV